MPMPRWRRWSTSQPSTPRPIPARLSSRRSSPRNSDSSTADRTTTRRTGMDTDKYSFFDVTVEDHIATAVFNGPDDNNRWALADEHELFALPRDIEEDDDIRVLVLTGAGAAFAGGAHHGDDPFEPADYYFRAAKLFSLYLNLDKPIVAAVNGAIWGSGLTLAMFSDIVIAERQVVFADAHVLGGVVSATGAFQWPVSVGLTLARRYLLTGDPMS